MNNRRVIARFHPQAWINDVAVPVDPEGPTEFDVTDHILTIGRRRALRLVDDAWDTDEMRALPCAPQWIREWSGPFYITVKDSITEFFDLQNQDEELNREDIAFLRQLGHRGFAVIVWTPAELRGANPRRVEDRLVEMGWDVIDVLQEE
jgi:hypothetical protein